VAVISPMELAGLEPALRLRAAGSAGVDGGEGHGLRRPAGIGAVGEEPDPLLPRPCEPPVPERSQLGQLGDADQQEVRLDEQDRSPRAALRERLAAIDEGTDCARHAHHLPALARRVAPADELIALRAHLRACGACRARLRELREPAA
jgi:hypothetical protein